MAFQIQFCLTMSVFQTFQTLCFSKLLLNCLGLSIANHYAPTTRAYIVDGLLLIFSSRHHQAESCHFIFSDVLHYLHSVFVHFVSWRGILPFPEFLMDEVGDTLFSIITLNFVHTLFAFFLFCNTPQIFLHFFLQLCLPSFFISCFLSSKFNFLPSVFSSMKFFK